MCQVQFKSVLFAYFTVFGAQNDCFYVLDNVDQTFIELYFDLCKQCNNCLMSFLSFSELFPAFNWAEEIDNLLSICFGVNIFSPCPCCGLLNPRIFQQDLLFHLDFQFLFLVHLYLQILPLNLLIHY